VLNGECGFPVTNRKDIGNIDFLKALKVLYRLISKLPTEDKFVYKSGLERSDIDKISIYFNNHTFSTKHGQPSTKIDDILFNYTVFNSAFMVLMKWPASFFELLDTLYGIQSIEKSKTKARVFGLIQKTHIMISEESPEFMRKVYNKWIRSKSVNNEYFFNKEFSADMHLYKYADIVYPLEKRVDLNKIPVLLDELIWKKIYSILPLPDTKIGSGNVYNRSVRSAKLFCGAYLYKLHSGCAWHNVPAVKQGLIKPGGIHQKLTILRKKGIFRKLTKKLLELNLPLKP
jgi:hypothetical protein